MSGLWRQVDWGISDMEGRCSHTATWVKNAVYIIGGAVSNEGIFVHYHDVWKISPQENESVKVTTCGVSFKGRRGHTAVAYLDRWIIVFGGLTDDFEGIGDFSNDLYIFDTLYSKWHLCVSHGVISPQSRRGHMAAVYGDTMIIIGGEMTTLSATSKNVYTLDLTPLIQPTINFHEMPISFPLAWTNHSLKGRVLPLLLSLAAVVQIGRHLFIYGGSYFDLDTRNSMLSPDLFCLHLDTYELECLWDIKWQGLPPDLRYCPGGAAVGPSCFIVWGGTAQGGDYVSDLLVFRIGYAHEDFDCERSVKTCGCGNLIISAGIWPQNALLCRSAIPCKRNAYSMTTFTNNYMTVEPNISHASDPSNDISNDTTISPVSLSVLMVGGGVYPTEYFNDCWVLDIVFDPTGLNLLLPPVHDSTMFSLHRHSLGNGVPPANSLVSYCSSLWPHRRHHDVKLVVMDGVEVPAHRIILAAHSLYFRNLFDGSWLESMESHCLALDVEREALEAILEWMYTGQLSPETHRTVFASTDSACSFLACVSMLDVSACKTMCEYAFARSVLRWDGLMLPSNTERMTDDILTKEYTAVMTILVIADKFFCHILSFCAREHLRILQLLLSKHSTSDASLQDSIHTAIAPMLGDLSGDLRRHVVVLMGGS